MKTNQPMLDQCDVLHLRGALVALNGLLQALPPTKRLSKTGQRVCDKACDARNRLRELLEEHDADRLTLAEFGGWEPVKAPCQKPVIREARRGAETPSGASHFMTHGSREDVVRDCERDFQSLPEWQYVIRELRPEEWHVWQEPAPQRSALLVKGALVERRVGA